MLLLLSGCSVVPNIAPKIAPTKTTRYLSRGETDVQYVDDAGESCALVQCGGPEDLCLVTIDHGPQKNILGRRNSMRYAERWCSVEKTVQLGGAK